MEIKLLISDAYLRPCKTAMLELFFENSKPLTVMNYFA